MRIFFFFQAEDGIRYLYVTGVQTCALPISLAVAQAGSAIIPGVRDFVEKRGVDVWLREAPMLEVSGAPAQDDAVDAAVTAARDLGAEEEAVPVGPDELAERCSSPTFRRGVLYR